MKNIYIGCILLAAASVFTGCDELIDEQKPQNSVEPTDVFADATGARAALNGAYDILQSANYMGLRYLLIPDMHGGNLTHVGTFPSWKEIADRSIQTNNTEVTNMWTTIYSGINRANQIIDKAPAITDPAFTDKESVVGQAYFLRAYHYFNLLRYWGGVPIKTTPSDEYNPEDIIKPRNTAEEVYTQIFSDLDQAESRLTTSAPSNKARAHLSTIKAFRARLHLYREEWDDAIANATAASTGYTLVTSFQSLWETKNTSEAIWEIPYDAVDNNQINFFLLPTANGGRNEIRPSSTLASLYSANDARRIQTTSTDSKLKYYRSATDDDNVIIFRLGEMILTRAEALIERNTGTDLDDAVTLINQIRNRANIGDYTGDVEQDALRTEVFLQRRLELALEGHYFFDLVRKGKASAELTNPVWDADQALLPIPLREINASGGVVEQNDDY